MGLTFILGNASQDHQQELLEQMLALKEADPQGKFYFIVPDHVKFGTEVKILDMLRQQVGVERQATFATNQVQVYSFTRLAWYFLKDQPVYQVPRLSQAGTNMLVTKILQDKGDDLRLFRGEKNQPGFVAKLVTQMNDLRAANISSTDLQELIPQVASDVGQQADLQAKLTDLALVYREYEHYLQGKYTDNAAILTALAAYFTQADLSHTYFFLDKAYRYNALEEQVLQVLFQRAAQVFVALVLDQPSSKLPDPSSFYLRTGRTYFRLNQLARAKGVAVRNLAVQQPRITAPGLLGLEDYWIKSNTGQTNSAVHDIGTAVHVVQAATKDAEVRFVANKIHQMVAREGYHYSDFVLLTPDLTAYQEVIQPLLQQARIPAFIDGRQTMSNHPLVELLTALFQIKEHNYQYQDMMRLLKTELLLPRDPDAENEYMSRHKFRELLDITENAILKYNFNGARDWLQKEDWKFFYRKTTAGREQFASEKKVEQQINFIRHYIQQILPPFFKQLDHAQTGTQAAKLLITFLVENGVVVQLQKLQEQAHQAGDVVGSSRPKEVWQMLIRMVEEYNEVLGKQPFVANNFLEILQSGFEGASYGQIPATLDQVLVSDALLAQLNEQKVTFILGLCEGVMPEIIKQDDLLTDQDRALLTPLLADNQVLKPSSEYAMLDQAFIAYLAFMSGNQQLYLSYPANIDGEKTVNPSPYVRQIVAHFTLPVRQVATIPPVTTGAIADYVGAPRLTLTNLAGVTRHALQKKQPLPDRWQAVYNVLTKDPRWAKLAHKLLGGLTYHNSPEPLQPTVAQELYASKQDNKLVLNTSISQLEEFYSNPYSYFLKYGLQLQPREVLEMSTTIRGTIFHLALQELFDRLAQAGQTLAELSATEFDRMMTAIMDDIQHRDEFRILQSSHRMRYLGDKIHGTIAHMGWTVRQSRTKSPVKTIGTEVVYGQLGDTNSRPGLQYDFAVGNQADYRVNVRGKVDRIDELVANNKRYRTIIDYKSSDKRFSYGKAYAGIMLQLLTYLAFLEREAQALPATQRFEPAGALYMRIFSPNLNQAQVLKKNSSQEIFKQHKLNGLLVNDQDFLLTLDQDLAGDATKAANSSIYPVKRKKARQEGDYQFASSSPTTNTLLTLDQLNQLVAHDEHLIVAAAQRIFAGDVSLAPARFTDNTSVLAYSDYKAIMQFDEMLPENNYRPIPELRLQEVLELLNNAQQEGDNNGRN